MTTSGWTSLTVTVHLAATLYMVGLVWFVQRVHYPLFARVGPEAFREYERDHIARTGPVVGPPMLLELASALALLVARPEGVSPAAVWTGAGLLAVVWASTVFLQVPRHTRLREGFDARVLRELVATNWIRTAAWTLRGGLAIGIARAAGVG